MENQTINLEDVNFDTTPGKKPVPQKPVEKEEPEDKKQEVIDFDFPKEEKNYIKVVGVGGGGCNAASNMYRENIEGVTYCVCDTNSRSLRQSPVPYKILLGNSGLGAGSNPERGRQEAEQNIEDLKTLFSDGTRMVFVTAGMGSGTGTGAAPLVASVAKNMGILTIGIVTLPFYFEKRRKIMKALLGLEEMRKSVDALLIINNQQLCKVYQGTEITVKDSFKKADQVLCDATRSISELITITGEIDVDFRDVEATMRNGGGAIMAEGRASGPHRAEQAIENALNSPLLYGSDINRAKRILFNIYTSSTSELYTRELDEIDAFMETLNQDIEVIWGIATDDSLGEDAKVTILATGFENRLWNEEKLEELDITDQEYLDKLILQLYGKNRWVSDAAIDQNVEEIPFTVEAANGETDDINLKQDSIVATDDTPANDPGDLPTEGGMAGQDDSEEDDDTNEIPSTQGFIVNMRKRFNELLNILTQPEQE